MTAQLLRPVRKALAAALILVLAGTAAPAQQRTQEQRYLPSPLKLFNQAVEGLREGNRQRARSGAAAERRPTGRARTKAPARQVATARLPKPRPAPAPGSADAFAEAAEAPAAPIEPIAVPPGVPVVSADRSVDAAASPVALMEIPTSFASAGVDPAQSALPVPEGIVPRRSDAESLDTDPPSILAPDRGSVLGAAPTAESAIELLARLPRPRPEEAAAVLAMVDRKAGGTADAAPEAPMRPPPPVALSPDESACQVRLRSLGVAFTPLDPIEDPQGCNVAAPLKVASLGMGVEIAPEAILNCRTTEALALWVRDSLIPASRRILNAEPNRIMHDSTYVCRPRNNQEGAKLSEHATANAVDIGSIGFVGRAPVKVEALSDTLPEGRFADAIRRGSCAYFTTVLGPGSNAAHATHFHFDMAERRGGHRLCDMGETETAGGPR